MSRKCLRLEALTRPSWWVRQRIRASYMSWGHHMTCLLGGSFMIILKTPKPQRYLTRERARKYYRALTMKNRPSILMWLRPSWEPRETNHSILTTTRAASTGWTSLQPCDPQKAPGWIDRQVKSSMKARFSHPIHTYYWTRTRQQHQMRLTSTNPSISWDRSNDNLRTITLPLKLFLRLRLQRCSFHCLSWYAQRNLKLESCPPSLSVLSYRITSVLSQQIPSLKRFRSYGQRCPLARVKRSRSKSKYRSKLATNRLQPESRRSTGSIGRKSRSGERTQVGVCTSSSPRCGMREPRSTQSTCLCMSTLARNLTKERYGKTP